MCAVSMITDYYGQHDDWQLRAYRDTPPPPPIPWPQGLPVTLPWDRAALDDLKDIIKRLDALDKKLGLAECEDPKKAEWMKGIEERLAALERAR